MAFDGRGLCRDRDPPGGRETLPRSRIAPQAGCSSVLGKPRQLRRPVEHFDSAQMRPEGSARRPGSIIHSISDTLFVDSSASVLVPLRPDRGARNVSFCRTA